MNVAELVAVLSFDTEGMKDADTALKQLRTGAEKLADSIKGAFNPRAIVDFVRGQIDAIPAINDLAEQTGFTTEEIQRLGYAASQAGSSTDEFNAGISKLAVNIGAALDGNEEATKKFKELGVAIKDSTGKARAPSAVLLDIADALAKVGDKTRRANIVTGLFGRGSRGLAQTLAQGSEEVRAAGAAISVLSDEEISLADNTGDAIGSFEALTNTIKARVALAFARLLKPIVALVNELVAIPIVGKALSIFFTGVLGVVLTAFAVKMTILTGVMIANAAASLKVAAAWAVKGAAAAGAAIGVTSLSTAMNVLMVKVLPVVATLALLVLVVDEIKTYLEGGETLIGRFSGKWGELSTVLYNVATNASGTSTILQRVLAGIGTGVTAIVAVIDGIQNTFLGFFNSIGDFLFDPITNLKALLLDFSDVFARVFGSGGIVASGLSKIPGIGGALASVAGRAGDFSVASQRSTVLGTAQPTLGGGSRNATVNAPITVNATINGNAPANVGEVIARSVSVAADNVGRTAVDLAGGG